MRLTFELRSLIGKLVDNLGNKSLVAKLMNISRRTVYRRNKRRKHTKDRKHKFYKRKVTLDIERFILALSNMFHLGTERIRKGLFCLPNG